MSLYKSLRLIFDKDVLVKIIDFVDLKRIKYKRNYGANPIRHEDTIMTYSINEDIYKISSEWDYYTGTVEHSYKCICGMHINDNYPIINKYNNKILVRGSVCRSSDRIQLNLDIHKFLFLKNKNESTKNNSITCIICNIKVTKSKDRTCKNCKPIVKNFIKYEINVRNRIFSNERERYFKLIDYINDINKKKSYYILNMQISQIEYKGETQDIVYLNVPYGDKEEVKRLYGLWDPKRKKWYCKAEYVDKFKKWL